ncbi:hypothetical protein D3C80_2063460 [compost metagenome]
MSGQDLAVCTQHLQLSTDVCRFKRSELQPKISMNYSLICVILHTVYNKHLTAVTYSALDFYLKPCFFRSFIYRPEQILIQCIQQGLVPDQ